MRSCPEEAYRPVTGGQGVGDMAQLLELMEFNPGSNWAILGTR